MAITEEILKYKIIPKLRDKLSYCVAEINKQNQHYSGAFTHSAQKHAEQVYISLVS